MNKNKQKQILTDIMSEDAENGVYDNIPFNPDNIKTKPFNIALVRDITDYWDLGEVSFSRMVEMLNDIAIKWHEQQAISKVEPDVKDGLYFATNALCSDITLSHEGLIDTFLTNKNEPQETWEDIEEEYLKDEYPVFGGPFTNAMTPFEWLKKHYHSPKRK
jgi:hypothetical protein